MIPIYYEERKAVRPILFVRQLMVFPGQVAQFDLEDERSQQVVEWATKEDREILVLALKDPSIEIPDFDDYYDYGTVISVRQSFNLSPHSNKILAEGIGRAKLSKLIREEPYTEGEVLDYVYYPERLTKSSRRTMLMRITSEAAVTFLKEHAQIPEIFLLPFLELTDPGRLADEIASHLDLRVDEAQDIISELSVDERLEMVKANIDYMTSMMDLQKELTERTMERFNSSQKEYMLREQMNIIREELGDDSMDPSSMEEDYYEKISQLDMPEDDKEAVLKEVERMGYMSPMSPEVNVTRSYLDIIIDLPWGEYSQDTIDMTKSRKILDEDHYGLKDVKERILEFIAVRQLRHDSKGSILCLVGPPGVGKTSIARSIAQSLNREFTSMRLGGVTDESEIRGHRRTYVGAIPGRIISQMTKTKTMNPVFLFDEIDKIGSDFRGDPASALLEVLDPEQNHEFQDRYLEIPFDLSQVMFLTTANTTDTIPGPLKDRLEIIRIPGYTENEKFNIAKKYLVPKKREEAGLNKEQFSVTDGAIEETIRLYTREAGVRELERQIGKMARRTAKKVVEGEETVRIRKTDVSDFLGLAKYEDDVIGDHPEIGVVNGLAWTEVGGEILHIEANTMPGRGGVQMTGSLGNVMKESAVTAISYLRSNADRFGIASNFYATQDVHIHMPEGAVPKDGPSAGVSIVTGLVSVLTNRPVRNDIAMTGEITLTGRVLAIGGVKEKILAAKRYNIKTVLLPHDNMKDLQDIEETLIEDMRFMPLKTIDDVLKVSLLDPVDLKPSIVFESQKASSAIGFQIENKETGDLHL